MLIRSSLALILALTLAGCASIDFDYPRSESYALTDTESTYLGRSLSTAHLGYPTDHSGFHPLTEGIDSLAVRLLLAERAEESIDVQYYLIKDDIVGRAFALALLEAADRGVRVRLLLNDMFTAGYNVGLAALSRDQPVRVFHFDAWRGSVRDRVPLTMIALIGWVRLSFARIILPISVT